MLNRRDFVKMAAAAGVAAILGAEVLPANGGELETVKPDQGNPIRVDTEWGRLREVIVGIVPDNAIVPPPISSHFKTIPPKPSRAPSSAMRNRPNKPYPRPSPLPGNRWRLW